MNRAYHEVVNRESLDFVRRLALTAQYNKPGVTAHIERIRNYCYLIATKAGLTDSDALILSYASQLHDIGEASVPSEILTKAGELLPSEWEIIKKHTLTGAEMLKGSPSVILQAAEVIALTHHERWNGSGYPYGMKGEAIPLSGRIVGLVDVFDALTTPRPYKKEMPVGDALALIEASGGEIFDPELVDIFIRNKEEVTKIRTAKVTAGRI